MIITIDGPSGSGKSTVAKKLALILGIAYLDTGAMYRGCGYYAVKCGVACNDVQSVLSLMETLSMEIKNESGIQQVYVNGQNVTPFIREHEISMAASTISKIPEVRLYMVDLQRKIAAKSDCVIDGRDIGSYVLPNADYKFFMTASADMRAMRRHAELKQNSDNAPSLEDIKADIIARDLQDSTRAFAPLIVPEGAMNVDTSNLSVDEVVNLILSYIKK